MLTTWNLKKSQISIITVVLSICGFGIPDTVTANCILTIQHQFQFIAIKSQVRINICNNNKLISTIIYLYLNTVKKI